MKLRTLGLTNFRNHANTVIEFDKLNLIAGRNGAGKSSIQYAIEQALTGRCDCTDKAGKGATDLIRVGAEESEIQLYTYVGEEKVTISRRIPSGLEVFRNDMDLPGGIREQQQALYNLIGCDEELIHAALNCSRIVAWAPADIKAVVFPLLGVGQTSIEDAVSAWVAGRCGGDDAARALTLAAKYAAYTDLDQRYKAIFEARKDAKKKLAKAEADYEATGELAMPDRAKLEKAEAHLTELRQAKDVKVRELGAAVQASGEAERVEQELAGVAAELKELNAQASQGGTPNAEYVADVKRQRDEATKRMNAMTTELAELTSELRALDIAIAEFKKTAGECPLASGLVKCAMDAEARKGVVDDLTKRQKAKAKNHGSLQKEVGKAKDELAEMNEHLDTLAAAAAEAERVSGLRRTLAGRLESLKSRQEELPTAGATKELTEEIDALKGRIGTGEEMIATLRADVATADRQKELRQAVDAGRQAVADYELLVEAFGPKGFRATMLDSGIGPLQERVNENLTLLTKGEYSVDIEVTPEFRVYVDHAGVRTELKHLSASERVRVGLALTEALVHASGFGVLVLDSCEILDNPNKNRLVSFLLSRQDDHETIIIIATQEREKLSPTELFKTFWVEMGTVEELVCEGASA